MSATKHNVADLIWKSPGAEIEPLSMRYSGALSSLYTIEVELKHGKPGLTFTDFLHAKAQIVMKVGPELSSDRFFGGIVTRLSQGRTRHGNLDNAAKKSYVYHVVIRPSLWLLTRTVKSRVYQNMTAEDIVKDVVGSYGIAMDWQVTGGPPERIYCVQYSETDYAFISRLLEDEGICFYFDQENDKVIFADHPGGHVDVAPNAQAKYVEEISRRMSFGKQEFISDFTYEETIGTGQFGQQHYNYETSQTDISAEDSEGAVPNFTSLEHYDHSQNYVDGDQGSRYAKLRKDEAVSWSKRGYGVCTCRGFEPGHCFQMEDHYRDALNMKWLLTEVAIEAEQGRFHARFSAQPAEIPFRPARRTPKPSVGGLQTATVTGPSGAEVYLDDLGRCKVQFHWDREGGMDDRSSMWVRVSNNYAGKDYGIQWIPRVGHDVVVTFIDGNPDLPLVTGRVYNDFNTPPLGPSKKYQNIIKSIKDNHIMMDDSDGAELLDVRAEKDMNTHVLNNDTQTVGNDRTIHVQNDHMETIDSNMQITVGANLNETVASAYTETVGETMQLTVGASLNESVGLSHSKQIGESESIMVGADRSITVGSDLTTSTGKNTTLSVGKDYNISVSKKHGVQVGDNLTIACDKKAVINVADQLTLKCGSSSIVMKKNGDIMIKGKKLNVKMSSDITMKGSKIKQN